MSPSKKKRFDFFTEYHKEKFSKITSYLFSGMFALVLAFSFVSYSQNGNLAGLMASVANLTPSVQYNADIILQGSGSSYSLIFGSDAKKVDSISFTLLSDPEHLRSVSSPNSNLVLSSLGGGMYHGIIAIWGWDITPGAIITRLSIDIDTNTLINLVDTKFVSEGSEYDLSNKTEQ